MARCSSCSKTRRCIPVNPIERWQCAPCSQTFCLQRPLTDTAHLPVHNRSIGRKGNLYAEWIQQPRHQLFPRILEGIRLGCAGWHGSCAGDVEPGRTTAREVLNTPRKAPRVGAGTSESAAGGQAAVSQPSPKSADVPGNRTDRCVSPGKRNDSTTQSSPFLWNRSLFALMLAFAARVEQTNVT